MNHASLFSGIGGFDLAAQWMGWENKLHCEINPFCRKILNYYWPKATSYEDIKTTDFTIWRGRIDILTGGFPCQPYSSAGKRLGKEDERHLWPEMLRAIKEIKPRWIIGENVSGLLTWNEGMVHAEVCADLEKEGYEVTTFVIPACSVDAPHQRYRVWIVAYCNSAGLQKTWPEQFPTRYKQCRKLYRASPNTHNIGHEIWAKRRQQDRTEAESGVDDSIERFGNFGFITHTHNTGLQWGKFNGTPYKRIRPCKSYKPVAQLYKIPHWQNFPTQSPVCSGDDGISAKLDGITFPKWRNESIKGYGNAVVPQVVYEIFKAIESIDKT